MYSQISGIDRRAAISSLAPREVDAEVAGVTLRRAVDPHVDFLRASLAKEADDRPRRVAADDRVVDHDDALALEHLGQRVELQVDADLAQMLVRLDERPADVAVLDEPLGERVCPTPGRSRSPPGSRRVGHGDDDVRLEPGALARAARPISWRSLVDEPVVDSASRAARSRCTRTCRARAARSPRPGGCGGPRRPTTTISPGWTSRTNVAPTVSSAQLSDAMTQAPSSLPMQSGRTPSGSRTPISLSFVAATRL